MSETMLLRKVSTTVGPPGTSRIKNRDSALISTLAEGREN